MVSNNEYDEEGGTAGHVSGLGAMQIAAVERSSRRAGSGAEWVEGVGTEKAE